jgi:hypothetical protein
MSIFLRLEFWLFAIAGLIIGAAMIAVVHELPFAAQIFLFLSIAWVILAILWMLKQIVRSVRG